MQTSERQDKKTKFICHHTASWLLDLYDFDFDWSTPATPEKYPGSIWLSCPTRTSGQPRCIQETGQEAYQSC